MDDYHACDDAVDYILPLPLDRLSVRHMETCLQVALRLQLNSSYGVIAVTVPNNVKSETNVNRN